MYRSIIFNNGRFSEISLALNYWCIFYYLSISLTIFFVIFLIESRGSFRMCMHWYRLRFLDLYQPEQSSKGRGYITNTSHFYELCVNIYCTIYDYTNDVSMCKELYIWDTSVPVNRIWIMIDILLRCSCFCKYSVINGWLSIKIV